MVLTGAKRREDLIAAFELIYPVLKEFKKGGEWRAIGCKALLRLSLRVALLRSCRVIHAVDRRLTELLLPPLPSSVLAGTITAPEARPALPAAGQQQQQEQQAVGAPAQHL